MEKPADSLRRRRGRDCQSSSVVLRDGIVQAEQYADGMGSKLVLLLTLFRTFNALVCTSSFVPDEYWQSLEVAHRITFGYGYLTWEWHTAIRGYTHPLLYAAIYKSLALLNMDYPILLVVLPRVLHVPLAVLSDVYVFKLSTRLFGNKPGQYALLFNVLSWFTFYCVTRTLSNSVEACLTPVVLYYWMAAHEAKSDVAVRSYTRRYLLMVGFSVLIRPTGVLLWAPLVLVHLVKYSAIVMQETIAMGTFFLSWSVGIDYMFYGKLVFVQWNFFKFNVLEGRSILFGSHSWHWYFTEGVAVALITSLPLVVMGVWLSRSGWRQMIPALVAMWDLFFLSFLGHKEHRFVFPIVPIASIYAALHVAVTLLLLLHVPVAGYFSCVHQSGSTAIMHHLRTNLDRNSSVLFLLPCHTTPFYSHVHMPITLRFLECPPSTDPDENIFSLFFSAPEEWLAREYNSTQHLPTHLVLYNSLLPAVESFVKHHGYKEAVQVFHTHFPVSDWGGTRIVLLIRN